MDKIFEFENGQLRIVEGVRMLKAKRQRLLVS